MSVTAIEILKCIYIFYEDLEKMDEKVIHLWKHWFRCKLILYATDSPFEKDLYPGSREPMHVLGINVL